MAGKITSMSKIKQMLLLLKASKGVKTIASITGISRNTIKSYKVRLGKMDASIDDLLLLDLFFTLVIPPTVTNVSIH
jgi:predicted transcriptional regulator